LNADLLTFFDICSDLEGGWGRWKGNVTSGLFAHRQEYTVGRPKLSALRKGKCIKENCSPCILPELCCMEKNSVNTTPKKTGLCQISFGDAVGLGNWPLVRDAEISLFRRAVFQPTEINGR